MDCEMIFVLILSFIYCGQSLSLFTYFSIMLDNFLHFAFMTSSILMLHLLV